MLRPSCVSYCTVAWTGVCLRGAWMIASVGVLCLSPNEICLLCTMDALSVGMRSDPTSRWAAILRAACLINLQLRGCNYHTHQLCFGNCSGPGIWRARIFLRPEQHGCPIGNVCEMVQFLWNMFYYNDINSGIYLQT